MFGFSVCVVIRCLLFIGYSFNNYNLLFVFDIVDLILFVMLLC